MVLSMMEIPEIVLSTDPLPIPAITETPPMQFCRVLETISTLRMVTPCMV